MGQMRNTQRSFVGNLRGRNHLRDLRVEGRTILKFISQKLDAKMWIGLN
jgi:hypothetical protein